MGLGNVEAWFGSLGLVWIWIIGLWGGYTWTRWRYHADYWALYEVCISYIYIHAYRSDFDVTL